jgi:hypothetical protein
LRTPLWRALRAERFFEQAEDARVDLGHSDCVNTAF